MSRDFFVYQGDFSQEYIRISRKINAERRKKTRQVGGLYLISGSYRVLFAFQKQILENKTLSAEEKIQMITNAIKEAEENTK